MCDRIFQYTFVIQLFKVYCNISRRQAQNCHESTAIQRLYKVTHIVVLAKFPAILDTYDTTYCIGNGFSRAKNFRGYHLIHEFA